MSIQLFCTDMWILLSNDIKIKHYTHILFVVSTIGMSL